MVLLVPHLSPDVFLPRLDPNSGVHVRCPFGSGTGIREMLGWLQLGQHYSSSSGTLPILSSLVDVQRERSISV